MSALTDIERATLLRLARRSLTEYTQTREILSCSEYAEALRVRRGVFVTLRRGGSLRGCIGYVRDCKPLCDAVIHCAIAAGHEDPRFRPVRMEELDKIEIEISVLSPLSRLGSTDEIEIGVHGVMVEKQRQRGLLLPQVALEHHFDRQRFLEETCRKAGLRRQAWQDEDTTIFVFTAEIFGE